MSDYTRNNNTPSSGPQSTSRSRSKTRQEPKKLRTLVLKSSGFVDPIRGSNKSLIKDAIEDLKSVSILRDFPDVEDLEFLSSEVLAGMGFTLVESEELTTTGGSLKDFTLINTKNDETIISNSKIVDPNISSLTPEKVKPIEKFKSETDKFYELDDERPIKVKEEEKRVKKASSSRKKTLVATKIIPSVRKSKNVHLPKRSRARRRR
jgi:hypothetical protein